MRNKIGIGISGTHGKTSTTAMLSSILIAADFDPSIIIGGLINNIQSNCRHGKGQHIIVEADEYDRTFLSLPLKYCGITNIDVDHLDCYQDLNDIKDTFKKLISNVPNNGKIFPCIDDSVLKEVVSKTSVPMMTVGFSEEAELWVQNFISKDLKSEFDVFLNNKLLGKIFLNTIGEHNVKNSLIAIGIAIELGLSFDSIQSGLIEYSGVKRRFEFVGSFNNILIYDDYAHHQTEIKATLSSLKSINDRRIITVFQPHLYSRTRDFCSEIAESLSLSDVVILAPIFPARETQIPGITSKLITDLIDLNPQKIFLLNSNKDIVSTLQTIVKDGDLILTMGAGDIWKYGEIFLNFLEENSGKFVAIDGQNKVEKVFDNKDLSSKLSTNYFKEFSHINIGNKIDYLFLPKSIAELSSKLWI